MVKKIDRITDLYAEAVREVSASPKNWILFLRSACRNYRLPFDEQLLIYKQRPDATAVLEMEGWNQKFGRWVKRDSKGIAVFDKNADAMRLKYYFDVSDTKEGKYSRLVRPVSLWQVDEAYRENVRETLANAFGVSAGKKSLEETILETARNAAEDNLADYLQDILSNRKDSYLEGIDEYSVEVEIKTLLTNSIAYMVLVRCGIDAGLYLEPEDFKDITQLNTPELVNLFGAVSSDVSGIVLSEISDTIKKMQSVREPDGHTFAGNHADQYNKNKKGIIQGSEKQKEGGVYNDRDSNRIQTAGRISSSQSDRFGRTGNSRWEIRFTPPGVSQGRALRDIHQSADTGEVESISVRDTGNGAGDGGTADRADDAGTKRDGRVEGERPDAVASDGKQHPAVSGRDSNEGSDLRLEDNSGKNKGKDEREKAGEHSPAFSLPLSDERETSSSPSQKLVLQADADGSTYNLKAGITVWIGLDSYEIQQFSDTVVVLHDITYPLFNKEMSREEFERKLKENPANDHLKSRTAMQEPSTKEETGKMQEKIDAGGEEKPISADGGAADKKKKHITSQRKLTVAHRNYRAVMELAPEVMHLKQESKTFEAGDSFMPLTIEQSGKNQIAVSHYFTENGDSFADPDMEFVVDHEAGTLNARTYQQDKQNIFERVVSNGIVNKVLEKELNLFASQWFRNIREQRYKPVYDFSQETETPDKEELTQNSEILRGNETEAWTGFTPSWIKHGSLLRQNPFDLHLEIPKGERNQYQITNDRLGYGDEKEKFRANIVAIQMLKKCEEENRYATPDEQEWLAGYVGWGGLSEAFDETKPEWETEYLELKAVLTEEEYSKARESTLTAFYTPPVVIRAMYRALENMGLKSGNILEPSCGTGNFAGMLPESLSDCRIYGVEKDSISGRIARQLYQRSAIAVQGYEEVSLQEGFFDVTIGNIPFGNFKVSDKKYDKYNFLIHDYFIAKSIDMTRAKGMLAIITSNGSGGGTMDKWDNRLRKYAAERCDFLGAVRLPNNTFLHNAGTDINADILFFQKRESLRNLEYDMPEWVNVKKIYEKEFENTKGENRRRTVCLNSYFQEHPEMLLGELEIVMGAYGPQLVCKPFPDSDLEAMLTKALSHIRGEISEYDTNGLVEEDERSIPADLSVTNFSYAVIDDQVYYRENNRMKLIETSVTGLNRIKGMVAIRDCTRELIAYQTEGYAVNEIEKQQKKLNQLYDRFRQKYGLLNARANSVVFGDDGSYPLLCSLEVLDEDGTLKRKADMFTKRTIKPHEVVTKVDTSSEALLLSLSEKACVDMEYMSSLTGKNVAEIEKELTGVIFRVPDSLQGQSPRFVSEDEYLSGNVRMKLKQAKIAVQDSEIYRSNVEVLERVQLKDLTASEIEVRLGATWIPVKDVSGFMFWLLDTPIYLQYHIKVHFSKFTGEWNIEGKSSDRDNVKANNTYGTHCASAYKIIEDTLNLRDTRIYDYVEDEEGKRKAVLNKKETAVAQGKQDLIKQAFKDWIWEDLERRQRLTAFYNENYNAIRPREYDGSHLKFYGMNPEIQLRRHQINGAARIIYGGNTLLAYVVGAGKTYTMVVAAMESKRLGLCSKSMVVVPNHIIEQFAVEWLQLYPAANLLVTSKMDFETKNRKKFCARIAASDVDAVIIGHSQFEKIPLSIKRQQHMLKMQIKEVIDGLIELKARKENRFSIKQMERTRKSLEVRLNKLNDQSRKDDVICFEELGVDRLFVDEADAFKNLFLYTKMRNVGGIAQTEAQKS